MAGIQVAGFDLDWTLADYDRVAMTKLTFDLTIQQLIQRFNYPNVILKAEFRPDFPRRGLLVDREQGIILKMNRHRYVGRAFLGREYLDVEERSRLYRRETINPASKRFYHVDTLFELAEVAVFSELVEIHRRDPSALPVDSYDKLFEQIRLCIDSVHADGSLKTTLMQDLSKYLEKDMEVALALRRLALGGRKIVLITNSEWYFTKAICSHLFDGILPGIKSWRDYFDLVIVSSRKPGFFREKRPFVRLGEEGKELEEVEVPSWGEIYSGGCRSGLTSLFNCPDDSVLYVGDHIYGDIASPKMRSMWRTALVVRELEEELQMRQENHRLIHRQQRLQLELNALGLRGDDLRDIRDLLLALQKEIGDISESGTKRIRDKLKSLETEHRLMRRRTARIGERVSEGFNPYWGSLFKQGRNKSLFGNQVDDFACIYTSRVRNFAHYGSRHYFRVVQDPMMHEIDQDFE